MGVIDIDDPIYQEGFDSFDPDTYARNCPYPDGEDADKWNCGWQDAAAVRYMDVRMVGQAEVIDG